MLSLCGLAVAAATNDFLVGHFRAGRISIRMSPAEAQKQYPAARVKRWEPYPRVAVIDIDPAETPGLRLHLDRDQNKIWLIAVGDKRYKTDKGITIGSTYAELCKAYPSLVLERQEGEMDRIIVAQIKEEGLSFVLEFDEQTWSNLGREGRNPALSGVPDEKRIQSISIVPPANK